MRGDPPRNPRRSTEKPTEMHRGPKNFDSSKKSNIKVADASTPTTVFSNFFSTVLRGTRQKLVARTVYTHQITSQCIAKMHLNKYMYILQSSSSKVWKINIIYLLIVPFSFFSLKGKDTFISLILYNI